MPDSNYTTTRTKIIRRAFRRIGIKNPSVNEQISAVELLNEIMKEIDVEGRWLWAISNTETSLNTVASQRIYATGTPPVGIKADILELENVELLKGTNYVPLRIIGKSESLSTFEREGTGEPIYVYLTQAPDMTNREMHFLPTPDAVYAVRYTYRRRLFDFDNAADIPDFPQDWNLRLVKRLANELAPEYGLPLPEQAAHEQRAEKAMKEGKAAAADKAPTVTLKTEFF